MEEMNKYKFSYNKNRFIGVNILMAVGLVMFSIFGAFLVTALVLDLYANLYFDIDLLIMILIVFSIIYIYIVLKIYKILNNALFEQFTYGFLGVSKSYSECYLEVNDDHIKIYNENIEHRFCYNNLKKVKLYKNLISFKYNKEVVIIPVNNKEDNDIISKLKCNLSK